MCILNQTKEKMFFFLKKRTKFSYKIGCNLRLQSYSTLLNIFLFKVNFDKSTIGLHFFLIFSIPEILKKN